jgi:hypothetical protein
MQSIFPGFTKGSIWEVETEWVYVNSAGIRIVRHGTYRTIFTGADTERMLFRREGAHPYGLGWGYFAGAEQIDTHAWQVRTMFKSVDMHGCIGYVQKWSKVGDTLPELA